MSQVFKGKLSKPSSINPGTFCHRGYRFRPNIKPHIISRKLQATSRKPKFLSCRFLLRRLAIVKYHFIFLLFWISYILILGYYPALVNLAFKYVKEPIYRHAVGHYYVVKKETGWVNWFQKEGKMVSKFMEDSTYVTGRVISFQNVAEGEKSGFRHENCMGGCPIISGEHKVKKMTQCVYPVGARSGFCIRPDFTYRGIIRTGLPGTRWGVGGTSS